MPGDHDPRGWIANARTTETGERWQRERNIHDLPVGIERCRNHLCALERSSAVQQGIHSLSRRNRKARQQRILRRSECLPTLLVHLKERNDALQMSGYCARCAELLRRDLTKRRLQTHERTDGWLRDGARLLC